MFSANHTQAIQYANYALHLLALGIVTGLIAAVVRQMRRAR
ncbi:MULTISPECIES: hypothetical protein [Streptomyces]|uniref:Uncharacterized protein n=1 Tax=Streptomyces avermitilis TaxID=33903 RepID=A0A4D4M1P7_STRAX|nr:MULTISPECIES: hypothetical protein [Streptomyces]BBJ53694.1 hypothetical protein SAVMC3_63230 [Streptomyces avermitilis]GDY65697.1 hypothetical protein SAV14893_050900 [Streptomyces avermitilis]GDY74084.1 hypothetical protein SAV31267_035690 [Streptomyces avermitilis]GDY83152.1 hypothetical protein SAVCW2_23510 [Streptomyces avermitilis]